MATAYTSLLGLALPVTGELQGTWGTTVNDSITSLLDTAVAGTTTLNTDSDVTLSTTTGAANQARQAIILWTANGTVTRNITAPAQSKAYVVINATAGTQSIVIRGVGPTSGVTLLAGEKAIVAWNGSDFVKVSTFGGSSSFTNVTITGTTTLSGLTASTALALNASKEVVSVTNTGTGNNVLSASPTLTGTVAGASLQLSSLTSGRVTYAGASGLLQDSASLTFDGTTLSTTTVDATNVEVTNIKAKDGTAAATIADSTGVVTVSQAPVMSALTASQAVFTTAGNALVSNAITGSGNVVMSASPTLTGTITAAAANFSGAVALDGNSTLGNAVGDTVTVNGTTTFVNAAPTLTPLTASQAVFTNGSKTLVSNAITGSGDVVMSASPTLTGTVAGASLQLSSLTSGRVTYAGASGLLQDSANLTFNGTDLTVSGAVNAGTVNATTFDMTNLEVTNIKAKDGTAAASIADSTGIITVSTQLNVDNLNLSGNTLSSTDANGNIVLAPNGTGDVQLDADTVRVGDSGAAATITTNGAGNLTLSTNSGTNSGTILINQGTNGNIELTPNGTGDVYLNSDTVRIGDANANATLTTNGTGDLILNTNAGTNSGSITIADAANGDISLVPNGNGSVVITNAGTSNALRITQTGTGNALLVEDSANPDATPFVINADGRVGIGVTPSAGRAITLAGSSLITGATSAFGFLSAPTINSDVTSDYIAFRGVITTAASAFNLNAAVGLQAVQGTLGAGSSITNLIGFEANSSLTGATNNYGFYSNIASGTGRWNFYANGTAQNYFAGNTLIGTTTNTNSSALVVNGTISETVSSVQYLVASQYDVGTDPNEIPVNGYLGALAFMDSQFQQLAVGTGITGGTGTICKTSSGMEGGVSVTRVLIDLTGLNSGGTAGDIIGVNGTANPCYILALPSVTVLGGRMTCLEAPAGGDNDIDLYSATEGTGVEDQAITALTETQLINGGVQALGTVTYFAADPTFNGYLYLVGQGTANATYTAGRFLIEIFGVQP